MAKGKRKRAMPDKKSLSPMQSAFIKARASGDTLAESAIKAGYSSKHAKQSGYQALQNIRGRVPDLMDKLGLTEKGLIENVLKPLLVAEDTVFFQKDGKVKEKVNVAAHAIRHSALRTAFELQGSYAPRDPKEAAQFGVKVVIVDLPGPATEDLNVPVISKEKAEE